MNLFQKLRVIRALALVLALVPGGCSKEKVVPAAESEATSATAAPETEMETPPSPFTVTLEASPHYTPGTALTVKTTMNYTGNEPVTALALQTSLPQAWMYGGIQGALKPAIDPPTGTTGAITLIWIQIPKFPATVEFNLEVPDWTEGTQFLSTQAIYRTLGGELESPVHEIAITRILP